MVKANATLTELVEAQQKLSNERAVVAERIKSEQLELQDRIDTLTLQERAKSFSDAEIAQLAKLRKENPETPPQEEPVNG